MRLGSGINKGTDPEESTQPLTLLPHKTQSKLQPKHSANPGFEGGQGGPGGPGLSSDGPGGFQGGSMGGSGALGAIRAKTPKTRKTGSAGGARGSREGPEVLKPEKRSSLLRSNIQRVPPFSACRGPPPISRCWRGKRGRLNLPSVQHANQGWRILSILLVLLLY